MYVFYSRKNQDTRIFAAKLCKEYKGMKALSIEECSPQDIRKYGIRKLPTVLKTDGSRLEGEQCKSLFEKGGKKYLSYNNIDKKGAGINNVKPIIQVVNEKQMKRDYECLLLPNKGLLGQDLGHGEKGLTDTSYENNLLKYAESYREERDVLESEIRQTPTKK